MRLRPAAFLTILVTIAMISLLILVMGNKRDIPTGGDVDSTITVLTESPFDAIFHFYKGVEANNWELVRSLTTPALWAYLESSGFVERWERIKREDPTLKFVLFIVRKQSLDAQGTGWVLGKADWISSIRVVHDFNRVIYVQRDGRSWKLTRIIELAAVETVDDFYEAVNDGDFARAEQLTGSSYWNKLLASGVLAALKKEQKQFSGGVYVVFNVSNFTERKDEAWVKGDVLWKPLSNKEQETEVNVHLIKDGDWKIDNIVGHWEMAK